MSPSGSLLQIAILPKERLHFLVRNCIALLEEVSYPILLQALNFCIVGQQHCSFGGNLFYIRLLSTFLMNKTFNASLLNLGDFKSSDGLDPIGLNFCSSDSLNVERLVDGAQRIRHLLDKPCDRLGKTADIHIFKQGTPPQRGSEKNRGSAEILR
jgi:hypothetical protein